MSIVMTHKGAGLNKLRFTGHTEPWEQKKLGEVASLYQSPTISVSNLKHGEFPVYGATGIIGYHDEYNHEQAQVVISCRGSGCGIANFTQAKSWINGNAMVLNTDNKETLINKKFLYQKISNTNFTSSITGTGQPQITRENVKNLPIPLPSLAEQERIGGFLSALDERLRVQSELVDLLALEHTGYSQRIFNQTLRFKDEDGNQYPDWEQKKLGEIATRVTRKNTNAQSDRTLTISAQHGLVDQMEYFSKKISSKNTDNYYLIQKGEFAYNKSSSKGNDFGVIKRLSKYDNGILSPLYICFATNDELNQEFAESYFNSNKWHKGISEISAEGARSHGLLNIGVKYFFNTEHPLPSLPEQVKIGGFLSSLSARIETERALLTQYKEQKKAYLQKLLP